MYCKTTLEDCLTSCFVEYKPTTRTFSSFFFSASCNLSTKTEKITRKLCWILSLSFCYHSRVFSHLSTWTSTIVESCYWAFVNIPEFLVTCLATWTSCWILSRSFCYHSGVLSHLSTWTSMFNCNIWEHTKSMYMYVWNLIHH